MENERLEMAKQIAELEKQIDELSRQKKELQRLFKVEEMIMRFEKKYPKETDRIIEQLVKEDESFEDWFNRIGYKYDDFEERAKRFGWEEYEFKRKCCYQSWYERGGQIVEKHSIHLYHLAERNDERLKGTKLYQLLQKGAIIDYDGLTLGNKLFGYWGIIER